MVEIFVQALCRPLRGGRILSMRTMVTMVTIGFDH